MFNRLSFLSRFLGLCHPVYVPRIASHTIVLFALFWTPIVYITVIPGKDFSCPSLYSLLTERAFHIIHLLVLILPADSISVSFNISMSSSRTAPVTFLTSILPLSGPSNTRHRTWATPRTPVLPSNWRTSAGTASAILTTFNFHIQWYNEIK